MDINNNKNINNKINSDGPIKITALDQAVNNQSLQIVKSALPYINYPLQKQLAVFIKALELKNTVNMYNQNHPSLVYTGSPKDNMLYAIRECCSPNNQMLVDIMMNVMNISRLFNAYSNTTYNNAPYNNNLYPNAFYNSPPTKVNTSDVNSEANYSENNTTHNTNTNTSTSDNTNPQMIDMLKSMLSKEQRDLFDMFSTMYNNNDQGKEPTQNE